MGRVKNPEQREIRVRKVPVGIRRVIAAHQRLLSIKERKEITFDEACIDLWDKGAKTIPALQAEPV